MCPPRLSIVFINMQCIQVHYSAVQCSAVQYSVVQCSAVQCCLVQCSVVQCCAVQCSAMQCTIVQCSAVCPLYRYVWTIQQHSVCFLPSHLQPDWEQTAFIDVHCTPQFIACSNNGLVFIRPFKVDALKRKKLLIGNPFLKNNYDTPKIGQKKLRTKWTKKSDGTDCLKVRLKFSLKYRTPFQISPL